MLAIAANNFDQPSETFIREHVRNIAPGRTVLLCQDDGGATEFGCPVLSDVQALAKPRGAIERIANGLRYRWWRYFDPALRGSNEARVRTFLQRHGVTSVLAEFGNNGCLLRAACKRAEIPLYVHFHGADATKVQRGSSRARHYRRLFRDASGIIVPSHFLAGRLLALGCPDSKLHVSPNGIDLAMFSETARVAGQFLAVGRLVEKKAPQLTIRAFAKVRKHRSDCTLDMVGDGPLWQACVDEIAHHDLTDCVRLHGVQGSDFVWGLLGKAEIFVQHSITAANGDMESFGVSLVEAMASSIPVVATDHNGFSETVSNGETGLLVAEHDVDGMADAMIALLEDRLLAETMGHAGRTRVKERFTNDRTAARLREIMGMPC